MLSSKNSSAIKLVRNRIDRHIENKKLLAYMFIHVYLYVTRSYLQNFNTHHLELRTKIKEIYDYCFLPRNENLFYTSRPVKGHSFITTTVNDINYFSQDSGKALRPNSGGLSKCEPYTLPYHHRYLQKCSKFFNRWGSSYRKFRTDHVSLKSIKAIAVRFNNVLHGKLIVMFLNLGIVILTFLYF